MEIRQHNELPVPVSVHLHGGKTPPESDGYPTELILPKAHGRGSFAHTRHSSVEGHSRSFKDYRYPNDQRAATLWYHDHRADFTGPQVYRGLAGMYILRDAVEESLPLPRDEKEVPLVIADRTFNEDGSFYYPSIDPSLTEEPGTLAPAINGMFGDTILVNGAPWPSRTPATASGSSTRRTPGSTTWRSTRLRREASPSCRSAATAGCSRRPSRTRGS